MVYPRDDRDLRARLLAQRSRELRARARDPGADAQGVMRTIMELLDEVETLLRRDPAAGGGGGRSI
jgi:hypothetical protein